MASSSGSSPGSGGVTVVGLLGVAFIVLKLCKVIDWSWWLVTAPFWGGLACVAVFLGLLGLGLGVSRLLPSRRRRLRGGRR
jgi:hypothetical protein